MNDGALVGPGADVLLEEARRVPVFLFGENHGTQEIAAYANALYRELSTDTPHRLVNPLLGMGNGKTAVALEAAFA